jgi:hypothetical protein
LEDNPTLMKNDPEYETRLMNLPTYLRRALRFGDWDIMAGQVFDEWRRAKHVVRPFALPQAGWFRFYCFDWGYQKPYAIAKLAVNYDGKVIQYGEIYGCAKGEVNKGTKESSIDVAAKAWAAAREEGVTDLVADPATWNRQDGYPAPIEAFIQAGFKAVKANNDRIPGLTTFHNFLKQEDENKQPMFQVFDTCRHTIRTLPVLMPDEHHIEDVESKLQEDHLYDAIRYGLMSNFVSKPQRVFERMRSRFPSQAPARASQRYDVLKDW